MNKIHTYTTVYYYLTSSMCYIYCWMISKIRNEDGGGVEIDFTQKDGQNVTPGPNEI